MVNFIDNSQRTAIYYLLLNYDGSQVRNKMIKQLIKEGGADLEHRDKESLTPLLYVCYSIGQLANDKKSNKRQKNYPIHKIVDLLLQYKDIGKCQEELKLALHYLQTNIITKVINTQSAIQKIESVLTL